jgi:hypothetical protein
MNFYIAEAQEAERARERRMLWNAFAHMENRWEEDDFQTFRGGGMPQF